MVYRGHVRNGKIELDQAVALPEGAAVEVAIASQEEAGASEGSTLYERMKRFIGSANGLPADASTNVDHYLYGHSK
jgi:hypothetical protein